MKKTALTAVFNYSKIGLTNAMLELFNLGLKLAILPMKLDITLVLVDFKIYERSMVWKEFFSNKDTDDEYSPPIFKTNKKQTSPKIIQHQMDLKLS